MQAACRVQFKLQSTLLRSGPQVSQGPFFSLKNVYHTERRVNDVDFHVDTRTACTSFLLTATLFGFLKSVEQAPGIGAC
jgi:hypothetical protein